MTRILDGNVCDVFLSYSTKDTDLVERVRSALESSGIRTWFAPKDLRLTAGSSYASSLIQALYSVKALVLVFSSNANRSEYVKREVDRALARGIPIIPVRIENTMPTEAMEFYLATPQWLDAYEPPLDPHLVALVNTVKSVLNRPLEPQQATADPARSIHALRRVGEPNPSYAAFWIGSRFAPALELLHDARNLPAAKVKTLTDLLSEQFEEYERDAGLTTKTIEVVQQLFHTPDPVANSDLKQSFMRDAFLQIAKSQGDAVAPWFIAGVSLSSLFSQAKHGGRDVALVGAVAECHAAFRSLGQLAQMSNWDQRLVEEMQRIRNDYERRPDDWAATKETIAELAVSIEGYLIAGECRLTLDLMQPIVEKNAFFAMYALERYCRRKPSDADAWYLLSKACGAEVFSGTVRLDPLFSFDKIELLATALERTIQFDARPDRVAWARSMFERIAPFRKIPVPRGDALSPVSGASQTTARVAVATQNGEKAMPQNTISKDAIRQMIQAGGAPPAIPGITPEHMAVLMMHSYHPWMQKGDQAKAQSEMKRAMLAYVSGQLTVTEQGNNYVVQ